MSTTYSPLDALHDVFGGGVPVLTWGMALLLAAVLAYAVWGEYRAPSAGVAEHEAITPVVDRRALLRGYLDTGDTRVEVGYVSGAEYDDYDTGGVIGYGDIDAVGGNRARYYGAVADAASVLPELNRPHEGVYAVEIFGTAHGDYVGGIIEASNFDALVTDYPDTFIVTSDAYGARSLWLPLIGSLIPTSLVHDCVGLLDYAAIDDERLSQFEGAAIDDAMSDYARAAVLDELTILIGDELETRGIADAYDVDIDHDEIAQFVDAAHEAGTLDEWINDALYGGDNGSSEFVRWVHTSAEIDTDALARALWSDHADAVTDAVARKIRSGVHY